MINKSKLLFYFTIGLVSILIVQITHIYITKTTTSKVLDKKLAFVSLTGLPDLAISTEATYIRHRSLSDLFSIYKDDGNLREYFPSTFVYSHSTIINNTPSILIQSKER